MHPVTPAGALVGRDSEMALLTGLIKDVARGRGNSVLIEGEPGIGKVRAGERSRGGGTGGHFLRGVLGVPVTSWARSCHCCRS